MLVGLAVLGTLLVAWQKWVRPSEAERATALVGVVASQVSGVLSGALRSDGAVEPLLRNLTEPLVVVLPNGERNELSHPELSGLLLASRRGSRLTVAPQSLVVSLDESEHRAEISGDLEVREELVDGGERTEQRRFRVGLRRSPERGWRVAAFEVAVPLVEQPEARP